MILLSQGPGALGWYFRVLKGGETQESDSKSRPSCASGLLGPPWASVSSSLERKIEHISVKSSQPVPCKKH